MQNAIDLVGVLDDEQVQLKRGNVPHGTIGRVLFGLYRRTWQASNQKQPRFLIRERSPGSTIKPILAYGIKPLTKAWWAAPVCCSTIRRISLGEPIMHVDSRGTAMMDLQGGFNTFLEHSSLLDL